jgi:dipeptidyl aminopeptidase/acylaminoacyl peptidase
MRALRIGLAIALGIAGAFGEVRQHPGGKEMPSGKYVHVVSEAVSPVQPVYIKSKDGLYVAAAMRKPGGPGRFPALVYFHGVPGGRGMEQLVTWSRGDTGGPVWERFLKEGFVVVVADYRNRTPFKAWFAPIPTDPDAVSYVDDGVAVLEYVRKLPYVDTSRITLYGVSGGGNLVAHVIGRTQVYKAVLGAPAVMSLLCAVVPENPPTPSDRFKNLKLDLALARKNVEAIKCPVLILVGTADGLLDVDRQLHDLMVEAGKPVQMEVYENGYHDFCVGPQGQHRKEPLLDATLDALDLTVKFVK